MFGRSSDISAGTSESVILAADAPNSGVLPTDVLESGFEASPPLACGTHSDRLRVSRTCSSPLPTSHEECGCNARERTGVVESKFYADHEIRVRAALPKQMISAPRKPPTSFRVRLHFADLRGGHAVDTSITLLRALHPAADIGSVDLLVLAQGVTAEVKAHVTAALEGYTGRKYAAVVERNGLAVFLCRSTWLRTPHSVPGVVSSPHYQLVQLMHHRGGALTLVHVGNGGPSSAGERGYDYLHSSITQAAAALSKQGTLIVGGDFGEAPVSGGPLARLIGTCVHKVGLTDSGGDCFQPGNDRAQSWTPSTSRVLYSAKAGVEGHKWALFKTPQRAPARIAGRPDDSVNTSRSSRSVATQSVASEAEDGLQVLGDSYKDVLSSVQQCKIHRHTTGPPMNNMPSATVPHAFTFWLPSQWKTPYPAHVIKSG